MNLLQKVSSNRAFISKVKNFIRTYPLTRKDPTFMIQDSIENLVSTVEKATSINQLELLSGVAKQMVEHSHPDDLCQFPVTGDDNRFLIYKPCKFLNTGCAHVVDIYDLLYIPDHNL